MCFWAGQGGTITLCASVRHGYVFTVAWATVCACASSVMSLYATDQRRAKIQKIVNWALFVLPLFMMSHTTQSERSHSRPPEFMNRERTSHQSGRRQRRECHVTLDRGEVGAC